MGQAEGVRPDLQPPRPIVADVVRRALAEDLLPLGDVTSALLPGDLWADAAFVARGPGVLAGTAAAEEAFAQLDPAVEVAWALDDGADLVAGARIGSVAGPLASILTAERTALNLLGHLSGIASLTRRFVDAAAEGGPARVWDTRKTTPGLRLLEKAAVRAGGGANHRGNLSEWVLLKDNHLALVGIAEAVQAAKERWPGRTCHVECDRIDQVAEAVDAGADAILCDNMAPEDVRACVALVGERCGEGRRPLLEASGGIDLDTIAAYAATGVDCISVSAITASAPTLDIGLDITT